MPEPPDTDGAPWRGIDVLGALVGAYCWTEELIFAVTGSWAVGPEATGGAPRGEPESEPGGEAAEAEARVWCAATSRRHGELAARWAGRLPARAGVDEAVLVTAPSAPLANAFADLAAEPDALAGLATLVGTVLPGLDAVYAAHLQTASPVSEAPVMEVLAGARRDVWAEIRGGQALLAASSAGGRRVGKTGENFERAFAATRIFPAVRPS